MKISIITGILQWIAAFASYALAFKTHDDVLFVLFLIAGTLFLASGCIWFAEGDM